MKNPYTFLIRGMFKPKNEEAAVSDGGGTTADLGQIPNPGLKATKKKKQKHVIKKIKY